MKFEDLELAFHFIDAHGGYDCEVWISRSTGEVFYGSDATGIHEVPEDLLESDEYVRMPDRFELDLGKNLVWEFVEREIPGLRPRVREIFSRRGAYGRYKDFLQQLGLLDRWFRFENEKIRETLLRWCEEQGIPVEM